MYDIQIKNLRNEKPKHPWDARVDRSHYLGNIFIMKTEADRDKVCEQYEEWFYNELSNSIMQRELSVLKDILVKHGKINLFCWCAPKRCHAETIKSYLEKTMEENYNE